VSGAIGDLLALERTIVHVVIDLRAGCSFDIASPARVAIEAEDDAFTKRVLAAPHRDVFDGIVVATCAWGLDVSLPVAGRFWSAAKGAPFTASEIERLRALVKQEADLVDPDRFASHGELRSLDAIDAALARDGARLVRSSIASSLDESSLKRRLSVLVSTLDRIGNDAPVDPIAIDVLACALRPSAALEKPPPRETPCVVTMIGASSFALFETTRRKRPRFRIEIDGTARRVRARITLQNGWTQEEETEGWLEGEDAELEMLVTCLEAQDTKLTEADGRLDLDLDRDHSSSNFEATRTRGTIELGAPSEPVVIDIHHMFRTGSFY
jgi:hypothetical protein